MIQAVFTSKGGLLTGFSVSGHAMTADFGHDVVCAAVSSAVMQCANTITEVFQIPAEVKAEKNKVTLLAPANGDASKLIAGLRLHLQAIAEDYPAAIQITTKDGGN